jgi:F-box-like/Leucine Rich repeat
MEAKKEVKEPNRFLLFPLSFPGPIGTFQIFVLDFTSVLAAYDFLVSLIVSYLAELTTKTSLTLGRRYHPLLNNLHISREQVRLEIKTDRTNKLLICMTNYGKNSTRVISLTRRKQARVSSKTFCRLVDGDVIELLYDQQGRYAFKLVESSKLGEPMLFRTPLVVSVTAYQAPLNEIPSTSEAGVSGQLMNEVPSSTNALIQQISNAANQEIEVENIVPDDLPRVVEGTLVNVGGSITVGSAPEDFHQFVHHESIPFNSAENDDNEDDGNEFDDGDEEEIKFSSRFQVDQNNVNDSKLQNQFNGNLTSLRMKRAFPASYSISKRDRIQRKEDITAKEEEDDTLGHVEPVSSGSSCSVSESDEEFGVSEPEIPPASFDDIPYHLLAPIFSYCTLPDLAVIRGVCRDWRDIIAERNSLDIIDIGSYFAGVIPPPTSTLISIAKSVSGKEYSFSNCQWLSTGALLHLIGIKVGIVDGAPLPDIDRVSDNMQLGERSSLSQEIIPSFCNKIKDSSDLTNFDAKTAPHIFLRLFLEDDVIVPATKSSDAKISEPEWLKLADSIFQNALKNPTQSSDHSFAIGHYCLAHVSGEVIRCRAELQWQKLRQVMLENNGNIEAGPASTQTLNSVSLGTSISRAYSEMAITLSMLLQIYFDKQKALLNEFEEEYLIPYTRLPLFLQGRNFFESNSGIASAAAFPPFQEARRLVKLQIDNISHQRLSNELRRRGISIDIREGIPLSDLNVKSIISDPHFLKAVTSEAIVMVLIDHHALHSVAAAYSIKAGDIGWFSYDFAEVSHERLQKLAVDDGDIVMESEEKKSPLKFKNHCSSVEISYPMQPSRSSMSYAPSAVSRVTPEGEIANSLGPKLPLFSTSNITGLDLQGCTNILPQNLHLILQYCPHLTLLRLSGCNQYSSEILASIAPFLTNIRQLDLEYVTTVNDDVLSAIGKHCLHLTRLQLVGCVEITDASLCETGLLGKGAPNLRRLNLRGCKNITDKGIFGLASRAINLRELGLNGLTFITAESLAKLITTCTTLTKFKGELWYDGDNLPPPSILGAPLIQREGNEDSQRRSYRLLSSVKGTLRYLKQVLPPNHELMPQMSARLDTFSSSNVSSSRPSHNQGGESCNLDNSQNNNANADFREDDRTALGNHPSSMQMNIDEEDVLSQLRDFDHQGPDSNIYTTTPDRASRQFPESHLMHPQAAREMPLEARLIQPERDPMD